jgi:hypothetical protein
MPEIRGEGGVILMLAALVFAACDTPLDDEDEDDTDYGTILDTQTFWAQDTTDGSYYELTADLRAEGKYCKVWVEQGQESRVKFKTARGIASEYDNNIYRKMIDAFSIGKIKLSETLTLNNTMEFADWLADGDDRDGKLNILLLDIRDGASGQGAYVAGYFTPVNFFDDDFPDIYRSNEMDMIYLDTDPAVPGSGESYQTLAHEMQHLMNFVTSFVVRADEKNLYLMDTWIDEGLSSAAEYIYKGSHVQERYEWYNKDPMGTIALGNNFFVWGNGQDDSILDDYATVYLFFQWLRIQASGSTAIYKEIIGSEYSNYMAVAKAAVKKISWASSWSYLLETWLKANYANDSYGRYGYRYEARLRTVKANTAPAGTTSIQLLPGEGVYSITESNGHISDFKQGDSGTNISYLALKKDDDDHENLVYSSSYTYAGGALLTYNKSIASNYDPENPDALKEKGYITGVAASVGYQGQTAASALRSGGRALPDGPFRIDARDMLARNGGGKAVPAKTLNTARLVNEQRAMRN